MRICGLVLVGLCGVLAPACDSCNHDSQRERPVMNSEIVKHRLEQSSGYGGAVADWRRFLSCWYRSPREQERREAYGVQYSLVKRDVLADGLDLAATEAAYMEKVAAYEAYRGIRLPRSYVDFLLAYQPELRYRAEEGEASSTRFVSIEALNTLGAVSSSWVSAVDGARGVYGVPDHKYFVYGAKQDDAILRAEYLAGSLGVGHYGFDSNEIISLNPYVTFADGEMEAIAYVSHGTIRATSFAELMRHIHAWQSRRWEGVITDADIQKTCAALLPVDAWWEREPVKVPRISE